MTLWLLFVVSMATVTMVENVSRIPHDGGAEFSLPDEFKLSGKHHWRKSENRKKMVKQMLPSYYQNRKIVGHGGVEFPMPEEFKNISNAPSRASRKTPLQDLIKQKRAKFGSQKAAASRHDIDSLEKAAAVPQDTPAFLLAMAPQFKEAAIEKGIEVMGKLVDKSLENIEAARENAKQFLKEKVKFKMDLQPSTAFKDDEQGMFSPSGYHVKAEVDPGPKVSELKTPPYNVYPAGIGQVMMNGCYGSGYSQGDPCYDAVKASTDTSCKNMIDGAAFIGVGFDLSGEYNENSRKTSIIQRDCAGKSMYEGFQVPDTMNVHGVYDTQASSLVFESQQKYREFLQEESGTSGSFFSFSGGEKSAYGSAMESKQRTYLSLFSIDVDRYKIFKDEVKPQDLSRAFLREFMSLPNSYYSPDAPEKYKDFILRWGTSYIKSGRFGGELQFQKLFQASSFNSKVEVQESMEAEYTSLFWSFGSRSSTTSGHEIKRTNKTSTSYLLAQGGSQEIASILSDTYSPNFKTEFKAWLASIKDYPKAFKFKLGPITELVNFRANDLFPKEKIDFGCESRVNSLSEEEETGRKYYEVTLENGQKKRYYCEYGNRNDLETKIKRKRTALKRAITAYMTEGPISTKEITMPATSICLVDRQFRGEKTSDAAAVKEYSVFDANKGKQFLVRFSMPENLVNKDETYNIGKNMTRLIQFGMNERWHVSNDRFQFVYDGPGDQGFTCDGNKKVCPHGLCLTFNEGNGTLKLLADDYETSKAHFPGLPEYFKDLTLARIEFQAKDLFESMQPNSFGIRPCNVHFANGFRFDPSSIHGACVHFSAASKGSIFVVFAVIPRDMDTWYHVQMSSYGVAIFKAQKLKAVTKDVSALALGDPLMYQAYFVCIKETKTSTVVEYGKTLNDVSTGDVHLSFIDPHANGSFAANFYGFGNDLNEAKFVEINAYRRSLTSMSCRGKTHKDEQTQLCGQKCHPSCDPAAGCSAPAEGAEPKATECHACRTAKVGDTCMDECPSGQKPDVNKECQESLNFMISYTDQASAECKISDDVDLRDDFSICMWMKFDFTQLTVNARYDVFRYKSQQKTVFKAFLIKTDDDLRLILQYSPNSLLQVFAPQDLSNKWFMLCFTRDGEGENSFAYVNGVKSRSSVSGDLQDDRGNSPTGPFGLYLTAPKDGSTLLEGFQLSDFNIWNQVLDETNFGPMMSTCGEEAGNWKEWSDFKTKLGECSVTTAPSTCNPGH